MARPRKHGPRVTTAIRVPEELHARLVEVAEDRDTSINHLMVKAADHYLNEVLKPIPSAASSR